MEPFGLFNLLKALLPDAPAPKEETEPSSQPVPTQTAKSTPPPSPVPNACAEFMARHDAMAKNRRK